GARSSTAREFSSAAEDDLSVSLQTDPVQTTSGSAAAPVAPTPVDRPRRVSRLIEGGTDGNERLTSMAGAILIVLLAVLGVTILRIGQLIWVHLLVGLMLLGPLAVKMASTGSRFDRYYTHGQAYRSKGPPQPLMRAIAPMVVASTVVVFVSGI